MSSPSPIDLTTLAAVKFYAKIGDNVTTDDDEIQDLITAFSGMVLRRTGFNSFSNVTAYVETRNGNGTSQLFLRNYPIQLSPTPVLLMNGLSVSLSTGYGIPGFFIADDQKSLYLRSGPAYAQLAVARFYNRVSAPVFPRGIGNIQISYSGGYTAVPADLEFAARRACALYVKRKDWVGLKSKSIAAGGSTGTTAFTDWELAPEDCAVIDSYQRRAIV